MSAQNLSLMDREAVIAEIKRLKDELERYKKAWSMVPDEWMLPYCNHLGDFVKYQKHVIARECGLEV